MFLYVSHGFTNNKFEYFLLDSKLIKDFYNVPEIYRLEFFHSFRFTKRTFKHYINYYNCNNGSYVLAHRQVSNAFSLDLYKMFTEGNATDDSVIYALQEV